MTIYAYQNTKNHDNRAVYVCLSMVILTAHDFWLHLIYAHAPAHTQAHMHMHTHTQHTHTHTHTQQQQQEQQQQQHTHNNTQHLHTHTQTHTQQQQQQQHTHTTTHTHNNTHTQHTHSWCSVFKRSTLLTHPHYVTCFFFSIFPCCRTPLRAMKKMHSRIRKDLDKAIETSFQSGSYSSYAEPKTTDDKQRDVCETFNSV